MTQYIDRKNIAPLRFADQDIPLDFYAEIKKGNVPGHEIVHKFGRNPDVDTATDPEDIWNTGGLATWAIAEFVCTVVSGSAGDDGNPIGDGALTLMIEGVDGTFAAVSEELTLEGAGTATTTQKFMRINRAYVTSVGTYHGSNLGVLTGQLDGNDYFTIAIGAGQTEKAIYTVPAGKQAHLLSILVLVAVGANKTANVAMFQYQNADDVSDPFGGGKRLVWQATEIQNQVILHPTSGIGPFPAKTDLWFQATEVGADDTSVDVDFELLLVDA